MSSTKQTVRFISCQTHSSVRKRYKRMIAQKHWNVPYVFKGARILQDSHLWIDGKRLADLFQEKILSFRIGKKQQTLFGDRVQFEKDCQHIPSTITDFLLWINQTLINHPLNEYSIEEFFAYADYMHLPELFGDEKHPFIDMIDWSEIGLKNRSGKQSTLWIGSKGAYTPCHYDTYGINFVAQIVGKKRWLLFPPDSLIGQLQTRIPYEESSVYLDIEPSIINQFQNIDVYDITLEPGDILFVPKHWWHFVSSLDLLTISINTWLEQPDDHHERIKEMLVRQILTSTMIAHDYSSDQWLNHNEIVTDPVTNLTILSSLLENHPSNETSLQIITPANHVQEQRLTSSPLQLTPLSICSTTSSDSSDEELLLKQLMRAITSRETIDMILTKLRSIRRRTNE